MAGVGDWAGTNPVFPHRFDLIAGFKEECPAGGSPRIELGKLLAILSTAKGAAAASVIVAAAVGTGVAATNVDVQTAISATVRNLGEGARR